ncbi:MAG TPA: tagaturonate epimerase family protein [bacterium]|nr:tagaturonate epimerase family protein [bacterium]
MKTFTSRYPDFKVYPESVQEKDGNFFFLAKKATEKYLVVGKDSFRFLPLNKEAVALLQETFPWLKPTVCGLKNSFGFGDRIGLATPGHLQALCGYDFFPVLAQQSPRELERTGRTFSDVLTSAVIGAFQAGYRGGFGADADHLKTIPHLKQALDAGFTFFTIDPSEKIRKPAQLSEAERKTQLHAKFPELEKIYLGRKYRFDRKTLEFTRENLTDLVLTYCPALDFIEKCYQTARSYAGSFDFEVSVDETSLPTTPLAHIFIVDQLCRRKIEFQSLALRLPGRFEKGIDYLGNLQTLEKALKIHQRIREALGPYKISLHSGSDKFSVYPIFRRVLGRCFHVKTSGTSWIEAIKTAAGVDFDFFLGVLQRGFKDFRENCAGYEISSKPEGLRPEILQKKIIAEIFSDNTIRQVIHISYGSILSDLTFREKLFHILRVNEEKHYRSLARHLRRHLRLLS